MKRVNQFQFYQIGMFIHPLTAIADGKTHNDIWLDCWQAFNWLNWLLADNLTPITTSRSASIRLRDALDKVIPMFSNTPADEEQLAKEVPRHFTYEIRNAATAFEIVFAAELETLDTYYVSKRGIYSTSDLIERTEEAFTQDVRDQLNPQAIQDIRQAGKCLAFDLDTASGFHIVRATEAIIHKYYVAVTGGQNLKRKDRNWGAYVRNLNAHRKANPGTSKADPKLISLIDQIREHHRNPVIHPEVSLTPDEAQSLFSICQAAIITFAGALKPLSATQLPLKVVANP